MSKEAMRSYLVIPRACEDHDVTLILGEPLDCGGSPVTGYHCADCDVMSYVDAACIDCHGIGDRHNFNCQLTWI